MDDVCHRCGAVLLPEADAKFCPQCGAPQLRLSSALTDEMAEDQGTALSPMPAAIAWPTALRSAAVVAGTAMMLFLLAAAMPVFVFPALLWTGAGSLLTLEIYGRRQTGARMDAAIGARIGAAVGVLLVTGFAVALATAGVLARFALHRMGNFDHELRRGMAEQISAAVSANPAAAPMLQGPMIPGIIAGSMLLGMGLAAMFLLGVSIAGGAVGGMMRARQPDRRAP